MASDLFNKKDGTLSIGVVVAIEIDSVLAKYGDPVRTEEYTGYSVLVYETEKATLYVLNSGAGEIHAAASTQFLITKYNVDLIVNFGVVGGLTQEMASNDLCVIKDVIHYEFISTDWLDLPDGQHPEFDSPYVNASDEIAQMVKEIMPNATFVRCASGDKFVSKPEDKLNLNKTYGAQICEMESAGIIFTCKRNEVPCLLVKAVADSLMGGGKEFFVELTRAANKCFDMLDEIIAKL